MLALGFSINTLTLFGLVLAIGIVVDDAIIVVENVERLMHEEHLPVREATVKAMEQVTGPVIAIVLVLAAVFVPVAFMGGIVGRFFYQFGIVVAFAVLVGLGVMAFRQVPVDAFPDISPTMVPIFAEGHGMAPEEIERLITFPIESAMNSRFASGDRSFATQPSSSGWTPM